MQGFFTLLSLLGSQLLAGNDTIAVLHGLAHYSVKSTTPKICHALSAYQLIDGYQLDKHELSIPVSWLACGCDWADPTFKATNTSGENSSFTTSPGGLVNCTFPPPPLLHELQSQESVDRLAAWSKCERYGQDITNGTCSQTPFNSLGILLFDTVNPASKMPPCASRNRNVGLAFSCDCDAQTPCLLLDDTGLKCVAGPCQHDFVNKSLSLDCRTHAYGLALGCTGQGGDDDDSETIVERGILLGVKLS